MAFGIIESNKLVNYTLGQTRVTIIGRQMGVDGKTAGDFGIYSALVGKPDEGFNPPIGTILARNGDLQDLYGHNGEFLGTTIGNYTLQERSASLSFINDFLYLTDTVIAKEVTKNVLTNMLTAEIFKAKITTDGVATDLFVKPYGTNGNYKTQTRAQMETDLDNVFYTDGKMVVPQSWDPTTGSVYTKENSRVTAYNTGSLCVMIETLTTFDSATKEGFRWVYTLPGNVTMSENMDFNKIAMDCAFLSDARFIENFWIEEGAITETLGATIVGTATAAGNTIQIGSSFSELAAEDLLKVTVSGTGTCVSLLKGSYYYVKSLVDATPDTVVLSLTTPAGDALVLSAGAGTVTFQKVTTPSTNLLTDLGKTAIDTKVGTAAKGTTQYVVTTGKAGKYAIVSSKTASTATAFGSKYYLPIYDLDYAASGLNEIPTFKQVTSDNTTN